MHFRKQDLGATGLVVLLLCCFALIFLGGGAVTVLNKENVSSAQSQSSVSEASSANKQVSSQGYESEVSSSDYTEVFAGGYDIREVKSYCPVTLPQGFGGVLEETRSAAKDFVSADSLCAVTDKTLSGSELDLDEIMASFPVVPKENKTTVVIYHTHTSEGYEKYSSEYYDLSKSGIAESEETSVVAVGMVLKSALEKRGFQVIHISDSFDTPSRSGSFKRSAASVEKELKDRDDIALVIDLHRDSILVSSKDKVKPTVFANGRKAAQIKLIAPFDGDGAIQCDGWEEKLSLALHLNRELNKISPILSLPVSLESQKYNLHLPYPCIMAEIGTDVSTAEEAKVTAALFADAICEMLLI